ncbi:MAG: GAF domain-containing SpoIIE family protein phosphatase [Kiritimatiellia bacterium]
MSPPIHFTELEIYVLLGFVIFLCLSVAVLFHITLGLRKRLASQLKERDVAFGFVHDVGDVFADVEDVDVPGLLQRVLFYALTTTKAGSGAAYLLMGDGETLAPTALTGVFPPIVRGVDKAYKGAFSKTRHIEQIVRNQPGRLGEGLVGTVAQLNRAILIPVAETDPRVMLFEDEILTIHTILLVPMRFRRQVIGVLAVVNRVDGEPFTEGDRNLLQALADQASVSLHYAQVNVALDEKRKMDYDLSLASRIQTALLPKAIPHLPGVELAAFSVSAKQVGGDYYDVVDIDRDHVGLAIADVSGKSVSGAIVMSVCRSLLRIGAKDCVSPRETLCRLNRMIVDDLPEDMFITFLYMVLNTRTRELTVARAGHLSPIVYSHEGGKISTVDSEGMAIGLASPDLFDETLTEKTVQLRPGDIVTAYTDGVTEAMDQAGSEWGVLSLSQTLQIHAMDPGANAELLLENIRKKLMAFIGETPQYDDITLVVLHLTPGTDGKSS